ncbi:MAG: histone deacetylase, partial [Halobacteriales archaeon]|nr:histone deacetylase [Halobacteriales archaeon]
WDVHHGNGTQDIFYTDESVYYASLHEEGLYPGTGKLEETGEGAGEGTTLNIPLPAGSGDAAYRDAFDELIGPAIDRFGADLVLVSAGFDPHEYDPISRMRLSTEGFGLLTHRIRGLAERSNAGLGFILEGGYGLDTLSEGVGMVHEIFDGRKPADSTEEASEDVTKRIERAREIHGLD